MSIDSRKEPLRVAVVTRTGRHSGRRMAEVIHDSKYTLCGVLAEKRSSMLRKIFSRNSLTQLVRQHGLRFLVSKCFGSAAKPNRGAVPNALSQHVVASLNSDDAAKILEAWKPDLLVVANAPILKAKIFNAARHGAVNFHSGRLPEYGGLESEFWALYEGEEQAWATIHQVVEQLDSGGILKEASMEIQPDDDADTLHDKLVEVGARLVVEVLQDLESGECAVARIPGPAKLRPWPTSKQRAELRSRLKANA